MASSEPIRIERLTIEGLFGPGMPPIDIAFKLEDRVTVLHGKNGSGKTVTLALLHAVRERDVATLHRFPFGRLVIKAYPVGRLEILRGATDTTKPKGSGDKRAGQKRAAKASLQFRLHSESGSTVEGSLLAEMRHSGQPRPREILHRFPFPWLDEVAPGRWLDPSTQELLSAAEALARYGHLWEPNPWEPPAFHPEVSGFLDRLPKVKFIKADRLFVRDPPAPREPGERRDPQLMVERLSADLREHVLRVDREYRLVSTQLDSSLRRRLFEKPDSDPLPVEELRARNAELDEQETRLVQMGLLRDAPAGAEADPGSPNAAALAQHQVLLQDREKKLEVFSSIVAKAQRLLESLNKKLAPKKVRLHVDTGYEVLAADGRPLSLSALSSGEQHLLVLLHELLFDAEPGTLILIDEPELSLHVTWQVDLLSDLLDIAKLSDLDFVLATHSPYIADKHPNLLVKLGEPA